MAQELQELVISTKQKVRRGIFLDTPEAQGRSAVIFAARKSYHGDNYFGAPASRYNRLCCLRCVFNLITQSGKYLPQEMSGYLLHTASKLDFKLNY